MLKLVRRPLAEFLSPEHQRGLTARVDGARTLAKDTTRTSAEKSKSIGERWDAFRAGRTSKGTFDALWTELCAMAFEKCAFCETPAPGTAEHLEEKAAVPSKAFDWENLLPACDTCNRNRENSGIHATPLDPSTVEPLDYFGWDEYGSFAPKVGHETTVDDLVRMYGLHRFQEQRRTEILVLRALLTALVEEEATEPNTTTALRTVLTATHAWLGPVRDYLLRPPTDDDALLVRGALLLMPEIRALVEPWLRPPPWAGPPWR